MAVRRYGEILKQIEPAKNQYDASARVGTDLSTSRKSAAAEAGLSERHMKNGAIHAFSLDRGPLRPHGVPPISRPSR